MGLLASVAFVSVAATSGGDPFRLTVAALVGLVILAATVSSPSIGIGAGGPFSARSVKGSEQPPRVAAVITLVSVSRR